ncbi:hypothetical protein ACFLZP_02035 [Patescibacteria group bacterium]
MALKKRGFITFFSQLSFLGLALLFFQRVLIDPDFGWHLRVGEYIWQTKSIPFKDLFSFSLPGYPYVYHSWLAELLIYFFYRSFGLWGVTFFYTGLLVLATWLLAKMAFKRVRLFWVFWFTLLLVPLVQAVVYLRVQTITFLGLVLTYLFIRGFLKNRSKRIWWLPLVFLFWANLHGGFVLGLFFLASLWFVEVLLLLLVHIVPFKAYGQIGALNLKKVTKLFLVILACALMTLVNPYGFKLYGQVLGMGTNQFALKHNLDWLPLIRPTGPSVLAAGLLYMGLGLILFFQSRVEMREKIMLLLLFFLSLKMNRFAPALVVVWIPALIIFIQDLIRKAPEVFKKLRPGLVFFGLFLVGVLSVLGGNFLVRMKEAYQDESAFAREMPLPYRYPDGAVEYIKNNPVPERIFNDYNWGGYLIWKLPERKFFIDGRMDNFFVEDEPFAAQQWRVTNLAPDWQEILENYQIEAILLASKWPVVQALRISSDWQIVYEDEGSILFIKSDQ